MKNNNPFLFLFVIGGTLLFSACKKDTVTAPVIVGTSISNPSFICLHQPGASRFNGQFVIFDLDHDANKDKKYFIVSLIKNGEEFTDSCKVLQSPNPIDSLALNWPSQIKSAAYGSTRNILTDAKNAVGFNAPSPWNYAPLLTTTNLYRKLNDPQYAAAKAGQKPYGNDSYSNVYYPQPGFADYRRNYRDIVYYFKEGIYTDNTPDGGLRSLDTMFIGAVTIDWKNIDQSVYVDFERINSPSRYYRKYYYFDWTNWKYYTVNEIEQRKDYLGYAPVY